MWPNHLHTSGVVCSILFSPLVLFICGPTSKAKLSWGVRNYLDLPIWTLREGRGRANPRSTSLQKKRGNDLLTCPGVFTFCDLEWEQFSYIKAICFDDNRHRWARGKLTDHLSYSAHLQKKREGVKTRKVGFSRPLNGQFVGSWPSPWQRDPASTPRPQYKKSQDSQYSMTAGLQWPMPMAGWWLDSPKAQLRQLLSSPLIVSCIIASKYHSSTCLSQP